METIAEMLREGAEIRRGLMKRNSQYKDQVKAVKEDLDEHIELTKLEQSMADHENTLTDDENQDNHNELEDASSVDENKDKFVSQGDGDNKAQISIGSPLPLPPEKLLAVLFAFYEKIGQNRSEAQLMHAIKDITEAKQQQALFESMEKKYGEKVLLALVAEQSENEATGYVDLGNTISVETLRDMQRSSIRRKRSELGR
eukprot:UC4_evm3s1428